MKLKILFGFFCFFLKTIGYSQNDLCTNAITLTPNTNCVATNGTFNGATISTPAPTCANTASQDVWYSFVATDPTMSVSVSPVTGLNVAFDLLESSCNGTSVVCISQFGGGVAESYFNNNFTVGQTYFIRVLNASAGLTTANFSICVQRYPTPNNDECAAAISLTPNTNCVSTNGTFSGSSRTTAVPTCANTASQDVWYSFVATDPTMSISVSPVTGLNVAFDLLESSCNGTSVVCISQFGGGVAESYFNNNFTVGQTYFIRVLNASAGLTTANFSICVQRYPTPNNDECAAAISLTPNTNCVSTNGTFSGSSRTTAVPTCANTASQDVWYSFVATDPTMSVSVSPVTGLNVAFDLLESSCNGTSVVCISQFGGGVAESYFNNNFTVGQTYFIRVLNASTGLTTANFSICVQRYPTPNNDECAAAISLTPNTNCVSTNGTFSGSSRTTAVPTCANTASQDVWYSFVATDPTMSVSVSPVTGLNVAFDLLESSCNGTSVVCISQFGGGVAESYFNNNFTVGQTYFIRVLNASAGLTTANFSICVQRYPTPNNDECAAAISLTPNTNCVSTNGTFSGSSRTTAVPTCANTASQDVWYSFVATDSSNRITVTPVSGLNVAFEIMTGNCIGTVFNCTSQFGAGTAESFLANNFVIGTTYFIRVLNASSGLTTAGFTICVQSFPSQPNDLCANAIVLTPNINCNNTIGSFSGATNTGTSTSCSPTALQDVWYRFVATDQTMSILLVNVANINLGMEILTGSCSGNSFTCDNSSTSLTSEFFQSNAFIVGQTYFVRVFHVGTFEIASNFTICLQNYPTPSNDLCSGAIALTPNVNCTNTTGSFSGSSNTGTTTTCAPTSLQDVWYSFVATDPTMSVWITNNSNVNIGMEIITGSCTGTSFVCDDGNSLSSEFYQNNTFVVGQTYYVRVYHSESVLLTSTFNICVQNYPTPANDICANAVALTPNLSCTNITGSFSGSSNTGTTTSCAPTSLQDVWYSFVATDPTMSVWITNNFNVNIGMEIITGSCTGTSFVCDDGNSLSSEFYQNNTFVVGQTYYVRVYHSESLLLTSAFNICVQNYPTPANDVCANAVVLTPNLSCTNITGSFSGSSNTGTTTTCSASSLQDVWYSFIATDPTMSVWITNNSNVNIGMEIITGSCTGTSFVCDDGNSLSSEFYQNNTFVVGQTYYVRVYHSESQLLTSVFNICVQNYPTPANDLCSGAVALIPNTNCVTTTGSFSGSSNTGTTTTCSASSLQDVWYSFVATDPNMSITLSNVLNVNLGMEIITGSCTGISFVCDDSSSSTSTEFYQSNTFVVGQTYYVRVFHSESLLLTSAFTICVQNPTLSSGENTVEVFNIYPNPVTDFFEIETNLKIKEVSLLTLNGQLIQSEKQKRVYTSNMSKGVYLVKVEDENGNISVKKIIKL